MTPSEALEHFHTKAEIARVLGITPPSVSEWFDAGEIPEGRQYQLEIASGGLLRADLPANRKAMVIDEPRT
ncbi:MAG TPA: Cro/CI family transcriptional regulator [Burkholderiaceae bacterium]|nr:Cro/CI family transcriptional regulator [Burkholderiaceae bacterium]